MESFDIELKNGNKIKVNAVTLEATEYSYSNCDGKKFGEMLQEWDLANTPSKNSLVIYCLAYAEGDQWIQQLAELIKPSRAA